MKGAISPSQCGPLAQREERERKERRAGGREGRGKGSEKGGRERREGETWKLVHLNLGIGLEESQRSRAAERAQNGE